VVSITLDQLNLSSEKDFISSFAAIFEHSPWVAESIVNKRPFSSLEALHGAMVNVVKTATLETQLTLIHAHPDLGAKLKMSQQSVSEQAGLGFDRLNQTEFEQFSSLNTAYREKFGFPFIIAVRNHSRETVLENFVIRLENTAQLEVETALEEIYKIAFFRLQDLIAL
jgi:2-oxo-4-hydroxy-4-carboxy-5-ureidoimidazoline decarboxylase